MRISHVNGLDRGLQFHHQQDDPVVTLLGQVETGVMEDPQHGAILGKDLRVEPCQPEAAAPGGEVPQQRGRDP